jgi:hypothetical protein
MANVLVPALKDLIIKFPNACIKHRGLQKALELQIDVFDRAKLEIYTPTRRMLAVWDKSLFKMSEPFTKKEYYEDTSTPIPADYIKVADFLKLITPSKTVRPKRIRTIRL